MTADSRCIATAHQIQCCKVNFEKLCTALIKKRHDETYMKPWTVSNIQLTGTKDRWDPEFKPSVEEITEYLRYLTGFGELVSTLRDFLIQSIQHMAGRSHNIFKGS